MNKKASIQIKEIMAMMVLVFIMVAMQGCKEERADMTGLLSTVPSSTSGVMGVNLKAMLEDLGCKIDDGRLEPGKELSQIISSMKEEDRLQILKLFDGTSGISPECAVVFFDANRLFLTMALSDVDKFYSFIEKDSGESFTDEGNGVKVCGNIAVKGAQAWICLSSGKRIDADAIAGYSSLKTSRSFISTEMARPFVENGSDITGWGQIETILSRFMNRGNMTVFNLAAGLLFEDASDLSFKIDFEKGKMSAEAVILNEDGKPAKYLLPAEKIDGKTVESIGESCDGLLAFTLTPKMVKKFEKLGAAVGLGNELTENLKNIDGTIAVASSDPDSGGFQAVSGVVTMKGDATMQLKDLITNMLAPVREDGKTLRFGKGTISGSLNIAEAMSMIKGACLGVVLDLKGLGVAERYIPDGSDLSFKALAISLSPQSGSLLFGATLTGTNPKENILLTLLK